MAHGGKRSGAGRKAGAVTTKTRDIADKAAADGITPLEVMLAAMRAHYDADRLDEAAAIAKDAAPYMHPRLATIDQRHSGSIELGIKDLLNAVDGISRGLPTSG